MLHRDDVARGGGRLDVAREPVELRDLGGGDALEREVERAVVDDAQHLVGRLERRRLAGGAPVARQPDEVGQQLDRSRAAVVEHAAARALAPLDQALVLELREPFADRGAVRVELLGELALGRKRVAGLVLAREDGVTDLVGDPVGELGSDDRGERSSTPDCSLVDWSTGPTSLGGNRPPVKAVLACPGTTRENPVDDRGRHGASAPASLVGAVLDEESRRQADSAAADSEVAVDVATLPGVGGDDVPLRIVLLDRDRRRVARHRRRDVGPRASRSSR